MTRLLPPLPLRLLLLHLLPRLLLRLLRLLLLLLRRLPEGYLSLQPALGLQALVPLCRVGAVAPHHHLAAHLAAPHRFALRWLVSAVYQPAVTLLAGTRIDTY